MAEMELDFSGKKGKEVFEELRETIRARCKKVIDVDVIVDDPECVLKVQQFSKMTGCTVTAKPRGEQFLIHISGDACKCV